MREYLTGLYNLNAFNYSYLKSFIRRKQATFNQANYCIILMSLGPFCTTHDESKYMIKNKLAGGNRKSFFAHTLQIKREFNDVFLINQTSKRPKWARLETF